MAFSRTSLIDCAKASAFLPVTLPAIAVGEIPAKNKDSQLRVFVNVLGDDKEDLASTCKEFVAATKAKNIPFVVPNEFENGPEDYGINAKAEVTVTLAANSSVKASHASAKASDLNVDAIIKDLGKILE